MATAYLNWDNIYTLPILHYTMESAAVVRQTFLQLKPDCVVVELPEPLQETFLHAASRLPDLSVVIVEEKQPLYYLVEPCDPIFEALRCACETSLPAFCIDLDVVGYPQLGHPFPDPYAIHRLGLTAYYNAFLQAKQKQISSHSMDIAREQYMAKRLKELSFSYDKILFITGMEHAEPIGKALKNTSFPPLKHAAPKEKQLVTPSEQAARQIMATCGFFTCRYERWRQNFSITSDRQEMMLLLLKEAKERYENEMGLSVTLDALRLTLKFSRNWALLSHHLLPELYQLLIAAKGCVDSNFAYHAWDAATAYPYLKNTDNLPEVNLTLEQIWGRSKKIHFDLKSPSRKLPFSQRRKDRLKMHPYPPNPYALCSYPKEDTIIETFADYLKKKGAQLIREEGTKTLPFSTSLEDGIDTRETLRHFAEKKLYVRTRGRPQGETGSIVMVFDEDLSKERFPWKITWQGEHTQESDMAFYATEMTGNIVGPGISRCEYGGFMMSYPPRRVYDIWSDPDYALCRNKAEVLLMAAIDYAVQPLIVYVAASPPRSFYKSYARRFGKKIVYYPIKLISPIMLGKIRYFHVLDSHGTREIADDYIF